MARERKTERNFPGTMVDGQISTAISRSRMSSALFSVNAASQYQPPVRFLECGFPAPTLAILADFCCSEAAAQHCTAFSSCSMCMSHTMTSSCLHASDVLSDRAALKPKPAGRPAAVGGVWRSRYDHKEVWEAAQRYLLILEESWRQCW